MEDYRRRVTNLTVPVAGGAVVTASTQGFGQTYLLDALTRLGPAWVGVTQVPESVTNDELVALDQAGIRAVRFNLRRGGGVGLDQLDALARRVHDVVSWHIELYVDSRQLDAIEGVVASLPKVSINYLGLSEAGLPCPVRLAAAGVHVKASGFGRLDFSPAKALHAIWDANPEALMFGTDLPCPRAPRPFAAQHLDLVLDTFGEQAAQQVLWANSAAFYRLDRADADR